MTCSSSHCFHDTVMDPWSVCTSMYVCVCMYVLFMCYVSYVSMWLYTCMYVFFFIFFFNMVYCLLHYSCNTTSFTFLDYHL
jgi:hypothetical protein